MREQDKSNQYLETIKRLWDRLPWYAQIKFALMIEWYSLPGRMRVFTGKAVQWISQQALLLK